MPAETLTLNRTLKSADGATARFATNSQGEPVIVWEGPAPEVPDSLSRVVGTGSVDARPCWLESRPSNHCLADLQLPLPEPLARTVAVQLTENLSMLHAAGVAHGAIDRNAVLVGADGACTWIGTARTEGTMQGDIRALLALLVDLGVTPDNLTEPTSTAAVAAQLRTQGSSPADWLEWLQMHPPHPPPSDTTGTLKLSPLGLMDEVQPEIGDDAEGRGLLDRWDHTDDHADQSDDSTESVAMGAHHSQTRQHVLSELLSALDAAIADPRSPTPDFRRALSTEPLDPLVPLNGLPHGVIHNPQSVVERTAEVSAPEVTAPSLNMVDETTGFTGPAPIQQSVVTGLLMAAVLGMVGAAIMLILVWIIIGEVF